MKKKILFLVAAILCFAVVGCSKKDADSEGVGKDTTFTYWIPQGEDTSYYESYDKNPGMEYLLTKTWKGKDGEEKKIKIDFQIPATGAAKDNLTTAISTGDYFDIMDMGMYTGSIPELYENGMILDLTPYMEEYMPNYMAFLDEHPDLKLTSANVIDGEKKYIQLYNYKDFTEDNWGGYCYRRDWLVKYGKNPDDGSPFSGEYTVKKEDGTFDKNSWVDNVVFPSGGQHPIYISDWEWMLEIFKEAIEDQGITDGYCMSLSYAGYNGTGDLVCAFGGGGSSTYKTNDNQIKYGLIDENFRVYLQAMNTWYKNGWIDTAFPEHSSDMFYKIDDAKVRQGKVGLWYGVLSQLIGNSDLGEGLTEGMVVYAARQPMNDIYGSDAQKNVTPYSFYSNGKEGARLVITDKAKEKDLIALLSFLDYHFTDEGMLLHVMGLNKEQYDITKNEFMTKYGMTEGSYTDTVMDDGTHEVEFVDAIKKDTSLNNLSKINRSFGLYNLPDNYKKVDHSQHETYKSNTNEWIVYDNSGYLLGSFTGQLTPEDAKTVSKIMTNIDEFAAKNIPSFIQGNKDPGKDEDWNAYIKAISKYNPQKVVDIYQSVLNNLK